MRILVTGSRDWESREAVAKTLDYYVTKARPGTVVTVVHGDCPKGPDRMAREYCESLSHWWDNIGIELSEERHPADWTRYGKRAGFLRNAEMVEAGADICLAFIRDRSKGATMTATMAEKASIQTIIYREETQ